MRNSYALSTTNSENISEALSVEKVLCVSLSNGFSMGVTVTEDILNVASR